MNDDPTPTNGKPYYCAQCGAGFPEFMSCELPICKLETEAEARKRMKPEKQPRRR